MPNASFLRRAARLIGIAAIGLLIALARPETADAGCCQVGPCIRNCSQEAQATRRHVSSEFNSFVAWLQDFLLNDYWRDRIGPAFQRVVDAIKLSSNGEIQANKSRTDMELQQATTRAIERASLETAQSLDIKRAEILCDSTYGSMAMPQVERNVEVLRTIKETQSVSENGNTGGGSEDGSAGYSRTRFERWQSKYCDPAAYPDMEGLCDAPPELVNRDKSPAKTLFQRRRIGLNSEDEKAAQEMMRNLYQPTVPDRLPADKVASGEVQEEVNIRRSRDARKNLARDAGNYLLTLRSGQASGELVKEMRKQLQRAGVPAEQIPASDENISLYDMVKYMAWDQFNGGRFFTTLTAQRTDALLRTLVTVVAAQTRLNWLQFEVAQRQLSIDAAQLALSVENAPNMQARVAGGAGGGAGADNAGNGSGGQALRETLERLAEVRASIDQTAVDASLMRGPAVMPDGAAAPTQPAAQAMLR